MRYTKPVMLCCLLAVLCGLLYGGRVAMRQRGYTATVLPASRWGFGRAAEYEVADGEQGFASHKLTAVIVRLGCVELRREVR